MCKCAFKVSDVSCILCNHKAILPARPLLFSSLLFSFSSSVTAYIKTLLRCNYHRMPNKYHRTDVKVHQGLKLSIKWKMRNIIICIDARHNFSGHTVMSVVALLPNKWDPESVFQCCTHYALTWYVVRLLLTVSAHSHKCLFIKFTMVFLSVSFLFSFFCSCSLLNILLNGLKGLLFASQAYYVSFYSL